MSDGQWTWSVREVFSVEDRVVIVGPLTGPFPSAGEAAVVEHQGRETEVNVAGLQVMNVRGEAPFDAPVWQGHPVALMLTGVAKAEVPIGAIVRGSGSGGATP